MTCTDAEVRLAIRLAEGGMRVVEIAEKMEVHRRTVYRWLSGQWRNKP